MILDAKTLAEIERAAWLGGAGHPGTPWASDGPASRAFKNLYDAANHLRLIILEIDMQARIRAMENDGK